MNMVLFSFVTGRNNGYFMIKELKDKIVLVLPISHTHYVVPPIGLGYLASALRQHKFFDVSILDCVKEHLSYGRLGKYFQKNKPSIVGFQVFSYDFNSVIRSIKLLKEVSPKTIVLVGGPHISATTITALEETEGADFGFAGEAEVGLPLLIRKLLRGEQISWEDIPGLIWREDGNICMNPRIINEDLDKLEFPSWDLMLPTTYPDTPQGVFYRNFPIAPISTSRGCPYLCTFCGSGVNMGQKLRLRSIKNVLEEMDMLYYRFGVREFHIIDDMFNFYKERILEFCQGLKERKWNISYTFPNGLRLNHLDEETLTTMKDTGLYAFTVGIESGSQHILDMMKKNLTLELIEEKINLIRKVGIEPNGFFILGYPSETIEDIKATIHFAKKLNLKRAHFSNFLPLPGTEITKKLIETGEIGHLKWDTLFYSKVAYSPKGITKRKLKRLQRRAYLEFYLRPRVLLQLLLEIRSFTHLRMTFIRMIDYLFRK